MQTNKQIERNSFTDENLDLDKNAGSLQRKVFQPKPTEKTGSRRIGSFHKNFFFNHLIPIIILGIVRTYRNMRLTEFLFHIWALLINKLGLG